MSRPLRTIDIYDAFHYVPGSLRGLPGNGHAWAYTCRHCGARFEQDDQGAGNVAILDHVDSHQATP